MGRACAHCHDSSEQTFIIVLLETSASVDSLLKKRHSITCRCNLQVTISVIIHSSFRGLSSLSVVLRLKPNKKQIFKIDILELKRHVRVYWVSVVLKGKNCSNGHELPANS